MNCYKNSRKVLSQPTFFSTPYCNNCRFYRDAKFCLNLSCSFHGKRMFRKTKIRFVGTFKTIIALSIYYFSLLYNRKHILLFSLNLSCGSSCRGVLLFPTISTWRLLLWNRRNFEKTWWFFLVFWTCTSIFWISSCFRLY